MQTWERKTTWAVTGKCIDCQRSYSIEVKADERYPPSLSTLVIPPGWEEVGEGKAQVRCTDCRIKRLDREADPSYCGHTPEHSWWQAQRPVGLIRVCKMTDEHLNNAIKKLDSDIAFNQRRCKEATMRQETQQDMLLPLLHERGLRVGNSLASGSATTPNWSMADMHTCPGSPPIPDNYDWTLA